VLRRNNYQHVGSDDDDDDDDNDSKKAYLDVKFILCRQDKTGEFNDPEASVLAEVLSMCFDALPRPHTATTPHMLTEHIVVCKEPSGDNQYHTQHN